MSQLAGDRCLFVFVGAGRSASAASPTTPPLVSPPLVYFPLIYPVCYPLALTCIDNMLTTPHDTHHWQVTES